MRSGSASGSGARSGRDAINPLRAIRLLRLGRNNRQIGIRMAREDGRKMPYAANSVQQAVRRYKNGITDEDGERPDAKPATNRRESRRGVTLWRPS